MSKIVVRVSEEAMKLVKKYGKAKGLEDGDAAEALMSTGYKRLSTLARHNAKKVAAKPAKPAKEPKAKKTATKAVKKPKAAKAPKKVAAPKAKKAKAPKASKPPKSGRQAASTEPEVTESEELQPTGTGDEEE